MTIRILIVDDHPIICQGMSQLVNKLERMRICCETHTPTQALAALQDCEHDLAIVDLSLERQFSFELIKTMLSEKPSLPILVMSMHDESLYAERTLRIGARGYIMKSQAIAHIEEAIQTLADGGIYLSQDMKALLASQTQAADETAKPELTDSELAILRMIGQGMAAKEIAHATGRSIKTVETHRDNIRKKLGLRSAAALSQYAALWESEYR